MNRLDRRGPSGLHETFYSPRNGHGAYWVAWSLRVGDGPVKAFRVRVGYRSGPWQPALKVTEFEARGVRSRLTGRRITRLARKHARLWHPPA